MRLVVWVIIKLALAFFLNWKTRFDYMYIHTSDLRIIRYCPWNGHLITLNKFMASLGPRETDAETCINLVALS